MKEKMLSEELFINYWENKHGNTFYRHPKPSKKLIDLVYKIASSSNNFFLDHGCGTGRISIEIAKRGIEVALNDLSKTAINKALKLFNHYQLNHKIIWYHQGPIYTWKGIKSWGSFCSHRVLHTIPTEKRIESLNFLSAGLDKGGEAIVSAKSVNCNRYKLLLEDSKFMRINDSNRTFICKNPFRYIHYFTEDELKNILKNAGLNIIDYYEFKELTGNTLRSEETATNVYWLFHCNK